MLLRIALLGSVIGVALLFLLASQLEVDAEVISRVDELPEGEEVEVTGKVVRATDRDKVMFLEIAEQRVEKVTVVLFKSGKIVVNEGDVVTVTGSLDEYEGKKQIIGNRVEVKEQAR